MNKGLFLSLVSFVASGCIIIDGKDGPIDSVDSALGACEEPVERPHDPTKPAWTYHGETNGEALWGTLAGYETCATGTEQSPIDIATDGVVPGASALTFANYDLSVPLSLWNNGHTLQVNVTTTQGEGDPQIRYEDTPYYLIQFHAHATSEHTIDGQPSAMELHFVHQSAAGAFAVVGLLLDGGGDNPVIDAMLDFDPGEEWEVTCEDQISLSVVPTASPFYHYDGSLTTPDCRQDVLWFVLAEHGAVSDDRAADWEARFGGTTNRSVQPLNERTVASYGL